MGQTFSGHPVHKTVEECKFEELDCGISWWKQAALAHIFGWSEKWALSVLWQVYILGENWEEKFGTRLLKDLSWELLIFLKLFHASNKKPHNRCDMSHSWKQMSLAKIKQVLNNF